MASCIALHSAFKKRRQKDDETNTWSRWASEVASINFAETQLMNYFSNESLKYFVIYYYHYYYYASKFLWKKIISLLFAEFRICDFRNPPASNV